MSRLSIPGPAAGTRGDGARWAAPRRTRALAQGTARRPPGEKPEQTLAPPQTPGPRRRRPEVVPEQIDEARLRLFVSIKPAQIIGIHNVAFGRLQHRSDFDAVIAANVKQTAGGADCKIFILEDIHYYGAAASIRDIP